MTTPATETPDEFSHVDFDACPERYRRTLEIYLRHGIDPGSFMTAVLANNLKESFACADETSARDLRSIVQWLYNEAPSPAWGSPDNVKAWVKERRELNNG